MAEDFLLLNPGPVPVTPAVREAMAEPMVSHRSADFEAVFARAKAGLDYVFRRSSTTGEPTAADGTSLVLNGTATMAMEAAVANLVEADSTVVAVANGKFGRRFVRIADRHCRVEPVEFEWGESIDVDAVAAAVTPETDVVVMVHNETSTGVLNPVGAVGDIARDNDAVFVVDGVTSLGGDEFLVDEWGVDVAITDAQKALAAPPGLSALYATERAIEAFDGERAPFYEDLDWHVRKLADDQTPFTSAVPLFRGLAVAVEQIRDEGMPDRIARHRRQAAAFREAFEAMGLDLFPRIHAGSAHSNTVTAVDLPEAVRADPSSFFGAVRERNVSISGGQAHLGGEIFRVSNMGNLADDQILRGVRTVAGAMADAGVDVDADRAIDVARERLDE